MHLILQSLLEVKLPQFQLTVKDLHEKKAQKNPKKNITSEIINKSIPKRKPNCTAAVWLPSL